MKGIDILGLIAATLTSLAFVPQVIQTWKTQRVDDISLTMLLLFIVGLVLWLVYGILVPSVPVIAANSLTLIFVIYILRIKLRSRKTGP